MDRDVGQGGRENGRFGGGIRRRRVVFVRVVERSLRLLDEKRAEGCGCAEDCAIERHIGNVATGFAVVIAAVRCTVYGMSRYGQEGSPEPQRESALLRRKPTGPMDFISSPRRPHFPGDCTF